MRQAADMRVQTFVFLERLNRNAPPNTRADDLSRQNPGLRADHGAALHAYVIAKADLPADDAVIFDRDAAADAGLRGDDDPLADVAVVTHVDHIVDLGAASDARATKRRAIYTSVHPQFNVVFDYD